MHIHMHIYVQINKVSQLNARIKLKRIEERVLR